jgi:hypothetical protein
MAATDSPTSLLGTSDGTLTECPVCGQPLLNLDAVERVEQSQREIDRRVESAIQVKAGQLAKQMAKRERAAAEKKIEKLTGQVEGQKDAAAKLKATHAEALVKEKSTHADDIRKLRTTIRAEVVTEAERVARAKVQRDLSQRDKLISGLKEQNEVQHRRIEHLTADERGEMNEDELVARLRVEFPEDRIERRGRGALGQTFCTRSDTWSAIAQRSPGWSYTSARTPSSGTMHLSGRRKRRE